MKKLRVDRVSPKVVLCIGLVILAGCTPRHHMKDVPAYQVNSTPTTNEAMLIFMRPTIVNQRQAISLFDTTDPKLKFVGLLPPLKKLVYPVAPGARRFMMVPTGGRADFIEGNFAPGKRYYVRITASGGVPHLYPESIHKADLNSAKLAADLENTTWVENTDRSRIWADRKMRKMDQKAAIFPRWVIKYKRPPLRPEDGR